MTEEERMPRIGTQEQWKTERDALLAEEKELTRRSDELARKRRELPWVPVEKDYSFETEHGTRSLAELFDGRAQLLVYHFMFGPHYTAGCPVCSSIADTLAPQVVHLKARDTTLLLASRAPLEKLLDYRERMGWPIDWVSSDGSDFNRDLGFLHTEEELKPFLDGEIPPVVGQMAAASGTNVAGYVSEGPGLSAYALEDGTSTGRTSPARAGSSRRWPTTGCSTARPKGAAREESPSTGSAATTSTSGRTRVTARITTSSTRRCSMSWSLTGNYVETCSCELMCPCNLSFDHGATYDFCRVLLVFDIREGEVEGTDVGGVKIAAIADTPKVMTDGNWRLGVFVDEQASEEQADKLVKVFTGQLGGPMAGLAPLVGEMLGVERARIEVQDDGLRHSVRVGDVIDFEIEDIVPFGI